MADDIVQRLRAYDADGWEAADEIERLRAEIERLRAECDDLQVLLRARTAEFLDWIERLRAAGDALAEWMLMAPRSDLAHELVAAWEEARREQ